MAKHEEMTKNAKNPKGYWGEKMIEAMNQNHHDLTTWGLSFLAPKSTGRALDIGCGGGMTVKRLAALLPRGKVYGVDHSALAVEKSKQLNGSLVAEGRVEILQAEVSRLPFENDNFDVITAVESFYFWPNPVSDLLEVKRVLAPGGTFLLLLEAHRDEQNPHRWENLEQLANMKVPSEPQLRAYLTEAGFAKVRVEKGEDWICILTGV